MLLCVSVCNGYERLAHQTFYKIQPSFLNSNQCINVMGSVTGNVTGEYLLRVPNGLSNIRFFSKSGKLSNSYLKDSGVVNLKYSPGEDVMFSYDFCIQNPYRNIDSPIVENEMVAFNAESILITPENLLDDLASISMDLTLFPDSYKTINSFNNNQKKFALKTNIANFRNSYFLIGKIDVEEVKVKENSVFVVSNGNWSYFKQSPSVFMKRLVETQREFWKDNIFPHYVMFLIKQKEGLT